MVVEHTSQGTTGPVASELCVGELAQIVGGQLRLASMPPLGGELEPLGRFVSEDQPIGPGDVVFVGLGRRDCGSRSMPDEFYARGALGVVISGRQVEPWAGRFSLCVDDTPRALARLARWTRRRFSGTLVTVLESEPTQAVSRTIYRVLATCKRGTLLPHGNTNAPGDLLTLLQLKETYEYAIVPLTAGSRSRTDPLVQLGCPDVAVLCDSVAGADNRPRMLGAETAIMESVPANGWIIIERTDCELNRLAEPLAPRVITVGLDPQCDIGTSELQYEQGRTRCRIEGHSVILRGDAKTTINAATCAFAVGRIMDVPPPVMAATLNQMEKSCGEPHGARSMALPP